MKELILGGARSGKSTYAERSASIFSKKNQKKLIYVATATAGDNEMSSRILAHRARRDEQWKLVEEPLDLAGVINRYSSDEYCILIDCLTLWLNNALFQGDWPALRDDFFDAFANSNATLYFVSNEIGLGVVPMGELSRQFVDEAGYLHQDLAAQCDSVMLIVAGLPVVVKSKN